MTIDDVHKFERRSWFASPLRHTGDVTWNQAKRSRLDELRVKEAQAVLTQGERRELEALFAELDAEEAVALRPAMDRVAGEIEALRVERARVDARSLKLEHVIEQQERLLSEVRTYAGRVRARRAELADEIRRLKAS